MHENGICISGENLDDRINSVFYGEHLKAVMAFGIESEEKAKYRKMRQGDQ